MSQPMNGVSSVLPIAAQFESDRLILRSYKLGDGLMYFNVGQKNRPHLQRYESKNSINHLDSAEQSERLIAGYISAWKKHEFFMLGAFDKASGDFVGQIYVGTVSRDLPEYEVGYFADLEHEGMGYITEAVRATLNWIFTELKAQRVSLRCSDTNYRSARVAERCGFTQEGHLRKSRRDADGAYSGDLIYGLLRAEFENHDE